MTTAACARPAGYSDVPGDCDDSRADVRPGAAEVCDLADNDCDLMTDEGVILTFYRDVDGDGYGVTGTTTMGCTPPSGYAAASGDCNDSVASVHPGATELCDGYDTDCVGGLNYPGEDNDLDGHGDAAACAGAPAADDCDDTRAETYPGATEICDRRDNDCSSGGGVLASEDVDGDGHAAPGASCAGGPLPKDDCDDAQAAVIPGYRECTGPTTQRTCATTGSWSTTGCSGSTPLCDTRTELCVAMGMACGDVVLHAGEECDDGNTNPLDVCDNSCRLVPGGTRPITPFSGIADLSRRPTFRVAMASRHASTEIALSTTRTFGTTTGGFTFTGTSGAPSTDLPVGRTWWRARAVSSSGAVGPWSVAWPMRIGRDPGDLTADGVAEWAYSQYYDVPLSSRTDMIVQRSGRGPERSPS
ncbi:MAG: MopE-related protein [Sandaracinaceae bacterium]|nr:MopE-related protein [Sandaracinaceae bacterium]